MDLLNRAPVLAEDTMLELGSQVVKDGMDGALVNILD
jgi:hypothetical protein